MFNLFKKKKTSTDKSKTILCIPGKWEDSRQLGIAIAENNLMEYFFAGKLLNNLKSKNYYEIDFASKDNRIKQSFEIAGQSTGINHEFLNTLDTHKSVVYLIGETSNKKDTLELCYAANAILKAGGIGVKVETAGVAFTKELWIDLTLGDDPISLFYQFVVNGLVRENSVFSCGMHNLGLKDAMIKDEQDKEALETLVIFNKYQYLEQAKIIAGQTFCSQENAPIYKIIESKNQPYLNEELFKNPFGMWQLKRIN